MGDVCGRKICAYTWDEEPGSSIDTASRAVFNSPMPVSIGIRATALLPLDTGLVIQGSCEIRVPCHILLCMLTGGV